MPCYLATEASPSEKSPTALTMKSDHLLCCLVGCAPRVDFDYTPVLASRAPRIWSLLIVKFLRVMKSNHVRCCSVAREPGASRRSGQGLIEFLLLAMLVVSILVGVFYPIVQRGVAGFQENLRASASQVVSQRQIGIPLAWFTGVSPESLSGRMGGAPGSGGAEDGGGPGRGGGDPDRGGGIGPGAGTAGSADSNLSGRSGSTSGRAGSNEQENLDSDANRRRASTRGSESGGDSVSGGTSGSGDASSGDQSGQDSAGAEEPGGDGAASNRRRLARPNEVARGGCAELDLFTLLKIAALVGLLILVGAVAYSSRKKKD